MQARVVVMTLCLTLLAIGAVGAVSAETITVGEGGNQTIAAAVANASAGDVVAVPADRTEAVTIDQPGITLRSTSARSTITAPGDTKTAIVVRADNVTIRDLRIRNPVGTEEPLGSNTRDVQGIAVRAANVTIENVTVTDIGTGSSVATPRGIFAGDEASDLRINDTVIHRINGSQADADQAHAIQVYTADTQVSDIRITNTTISNITDGRHVTAVHLNGNITGELDNNTIRGLNTVNTTGIRGFTQAITLTQGVNVAGAPRDVTIANNTIADLENTSRPNYVPATHINLHENVTGIDIRDNRFEITSGIGQVLTPPPGADLRLNTLVQDPFAHTELRVNELYVVDNSGAFDPGDIANNSFSQSAVIDSTSVPGTNYSLPQAGAAALASAAIQSAVDAAAVDGTVVIPNGTYDETVTIGTEGVTLEGAQAGVDARGDRGPESHINNTSTTAPPLKIDASGVTIDGIAVESDHRSGIEIRNASVDDVRITNVAVTGVNSTSQDARGILLYATDGTAETIENISISRSVIGGLQKANSRYSTGITFLPKQNDLRNVTVTDVRIDGITGAREARGIEVHAQNTSAQTVTDVRITNTTVANLTGPGVRGISLFETDDDPRIGPTNVTIRNVTVAQTDATTTPTNETNISLFIGGYERLGAGHLVDGLDADGTVVRYNTNQSGFHIADAESLNLTDSTMRNLQVARTDGLRNLTITDGLRVNRTQAGALDPVLTRVDRALANVSATRTDPAVPTSISLTLTDPETISVDLRTTAPVSGVTVDLDNATAGGATELTKTKLTETVGADGTARYTTTFRADTSGGPLRYHASIDAVDGFTDTDEVLETSRPLLVRPPAPAGPAQPVEVTPTTSVAEEVMIAPDSDTEITVGGITPQLPDDPDRSTSALREDLGDAGADPIVAMEVEAADPTGATIELRIDTSSITDVDALAATRFNASSDEFELIPTAVVDSTAEWVDLEVETPGFSLLAVVETDKDPPALSPTPSPSGGGGSSGGGGGGGGAGSSQQVIHTLTTPVDTRVAIVDPPAPGTISVQPLAEPTQDRFENATVITGFALTAAEAPAEPIDLEISVDQGRVDDPEALTVLHHPADGSPAVRPPVIEVAEEGTQVIVRTRVETRGDVRLVAAAERPPAVTEPGGQPASEQLEAPASEPDTPTPSTDRPIPGFTIAIAALSLLLAFGLLRLR